MSDDLLITGIGAIVSGDLTAPILAGDSVLCRDGLIAAVGRLDDVHPGGTPRTIDANGTTLVPGLIDAHTHPVLGDYTPRQNTSGWIESYVHGGVTTLVSCGEPHTPGRPRDAAGVKALAILAHKSFATVRPLGAKVHAGALLLEPGLTEEDFAEAAAEGCWLLGEIGISSVSDPAAAVPLVEAAKRHGFLVPVHVGGASVPGSTVIGADMVVAVQPDVAVHCNGGPTAPSHDDVVRIIEETDAAIEIVQAGNTRALRDVVRELMRRDLVDRLQIGSDTPSGTGVIPVGILRTMAYASALAGLEPELAVCAATGSTARRYRRNTGIIEPGREADLVFLSTPRGSAAPTALEALRAGDIPAVCGVIIDGVVRVTASRVTPPPSHAPSFG
ncbi:amidohydrolase family protein [Microtetraspora fusca]|uniref:Amidohydrolase family protein n=1 Tax=Microtetraspora fusca TaxID=1997 RepID=A0ABW6VAN7_MICFU